MGDRVHDRDTAVEVARGYADEECVGEVDTIGRVSREGETWVVEFVTQTFTDAYEHRVRISSPGNVFSHDQTRRGDDEESAER